MAKEKTTKGTDLLIEEPSTLRNVQYTRHLGGDTLLVKAKLRTYEDYTEEVIWSVELVDEFDKWHDVVAGQVMVWNVPAKHILELRGNEGGIEPYYINETDEDVTLAELDSEGVLFLVVLRGQAWRHKKLGKDKKR